MDELQLRTLLRAQGRWSLRRKRIKGRRAFYYYASRKIAGTQQLEERYLCPVESLADKTESDIVAKLFPVPPNAPASNGNSRQEQPE